MNKITVKGLQTQSVNVTIYKSELIEAAMNNLQYEDLYNILRKVLYKEMDLPYDAFIKEDKWLQEVEYYGSHSWTDDKFLRDVTEDDMKFLKVLESYKELL